VTWECFECAQESEDHLTSACHHCGKLLCVNHARWLYDRAFAIDRKQGAPAPTAVHCSACATRDHSGVA
jgi:hypothetical protein